MWTKKQKLAIDIQDKNILVAASAGSGKTAVVIERVIDKVIKYKIDIDKILVVTFTNAAANELKERLYKALSSKINENPKDIFLKRQLKLLTRASITTLDSFCIELVRSNFNILGIDPNFKICDNIKSEMLKNKVIKNILDAKYKNENNIESSVSSNYEVSLGLFKILELFGGKEENLISTIFEIYTYIQSFPYPFSYLKEMVEKYYVDDIENVDLSQTDFGKDIIKEAVANLELLLKRTNIIREEIAGIEEFKKHVILLDEDISTLKVCINESGLWDSLYKALHTSSFKNNLLTKVSNVELKDKIKDYRANVLKKTFLEIQNSIYERSSEILKDNNNAYYYLKYLYDFLVLFDNSFKEEKRKSNLLEFNDIHHLALELLYIKKEDGISYTDVTLNLQQKYVEVYTDEYQDTDFVQESILEAVSGSKNRFMVGDIKQSIYKFRQARPEIFNNKYDNYTLIESEESLGEGKEFENVKIVLDDNFRSKKQVIDGINYIFSKIMSKNMGECSYTDVETLKYGASWYKDYSGQSYNTEVNIIDMNNKENKEIYEDSQDESLKEVLELQKFEKEAIFISKRINKLMKEYKVYDSKKDIFRDIKYSDIVILLRAVKNKGVILEETLKKYGIPAYSDVSSNLFLSEEVMLVISFLNVIDNPLCDVDMISIMYSIIGKFSLDEIAKIKLYNENKKCSVYDSLNIYKSYLESLEKEKLDSCDYYLLGKITNFLDLISKFKNYSKIYKISDILVKMYKETNIYFQFMLDNQKESKIANLNLLVDIARDYEKNTSYTLNSYIKYIDNLKKMDSSNGEAKVIGENEDVVRIMTIHKSKGLEFPVVILCDTTSEYNEKEFSKQVILNQDLGVGINIVNEDLEITYPSVIKQAIKQKSKKEARSEALRVLYVALTRAKEKLIVFASVQNYNKFNENQFVMYDNSDLGEVVSPMIVLGNNSYFSNINMALKKYNGNELPDDEKIFDINRLNFNITDINEENKSVNDDESRNIKSDKVNVDEKVNILKDYVGKCMELENQNSSFENISKIKDVLIKNLEHKYENESLISTASRVSVSKLKEEYIKENSDSEEIYIKGSIVKEDEEFYRNDGSDSNENCDVKNLDFKIPSILDENSKKYTPVRKGTLIHFVLEMLDLDKITTKDSLREYIDNLVANKYINDEDLKHINVDKIYTFVNSKLGKQIKNSNLVKKEEEFILRNTKFSDSIIQGVIDLYYVNDSKNVVLVDFKTDRIKEEYKYIEKYKLQLDIYKEAIEKLTGYKVDKKYIYSFELGREIEVN